MQEVEREKGWKHDVFRDLASEVTSHIFVIFCGLYRPSLVKCWKRWHKGLNARRWESLRTNLEASCHRLIWQSSFKKFSFLCFCVDCCIKTIPKCLGLKEQPFISCSISAGRQLDQAQLGCLASAPSSVRWATVVGWSKMTLYMCI